MMECKEAKETTEEEEESSEVASGDAQSDTLKIIPSEDPCERSLRFRILAEDESDVFKVYDVTETCVTPDKTLICLLMMDAVDDTPLLKVSHRKSIASVTICSPSGVLIGESISELRIRCCSIKPKYTLLSRFGKQLLILDGKARCCPPGLNVRVKTGGVDGRDLGTISMPTISSFSAVVNFTPGEQVSFNSRNLILGMAIGIILQSQDARIDD